MKKRLSLIMLLVVLGAAKAQAADYDVDRYTDDYSTTSLRYALNDSYDEVSTINFTGYTGPIRYSIDSDNGSLRTILENHTFTAPNGQVTLGWDNATNSYLLQTADGEDGSPWLQISDDLDFDAYGLYDVTGIDGEDSLVFHGGFGSDVTVETGEDGLARGLAAEESLIIESSGIGEDSGSFTGNLDVTAKTHHATGMLARDGDIAIEDNLDGSISVEAGTRHANGLWSLGEDISIGGDVSTEMTVTAGSDFAFGLHAGEDIVIGGQGMGDLGGTFNIWAQDDRAYGLRAGEDIMIGNDVTGTFNVRAGYEDAPVNPNDSAYGFLAGEDILIGGDFTGNIDANAHNSIAVGMMAGGDYIDLEDAQGGGLIGFPGKGGGPGSGDIALRGDLDGTIDVDAGEDMAVGLFAANDISAGNDLAGDITSEAGEDGAFGIVAMDDIEIGNDLSGTIDVKAGEDMAVGLLSFDNTTVGEDLSGTITVESGRNGAVGIMAFNNIEIGNEFSGTVTATAGEDGAVGLFAGDDLEIGGNTFTGNIHATSEGDFAAGIFTFGGVYGAGESSDGPGGFGPPYDNEFLIYGDGEGNGQITASAAADESFAAGILALDGMNLRITGDALISATAGEDGQANAIASGFRDAQDQVTIEDTSTLVGNVFLGGGEDMMTVKDQAQIDQVARLNGGHDRSKGGMSERDVLTFDGWQGTVGDEVVNWEEINVLNESVVDLGSSKDGEDFLAISTAGEDLVLTVEEGSRVVSHGNSPSYQQVIGDYVNGGVLDLLDDEGNDVFEVTGDYSSDNDTGELWLDADLSTSGVDAGDYLEIGGDVDGETTVILNNTVSLVDVTEGDGIRIVRVGNESGGDGSFVLGNPDDFGPFAVEIGEGGGDDWFIQSPGYREEAAAIQAVTPFMNRLGYESVMKFHERRAYGWFRNDSGEHESWWVRATGSKYRQGMEGDAAAEFEGYTGWMQVGTDLIADGDKGGRFDLGIFAGAGYGWAEVDGLRSDKAGELSQTAYELSLNVVFQG
ncbi:hypothetical protein [Prosthecochloris sp. ZM_2]|uniref:hypothetical protein n=1 Tax=Prosthecochloris sp. ZM_2 TaxID=2045206 RepID=UPI0011CD412F|nr:hypothetical protein [Prosthecochloris sp. ZM_2]